MELTLIATVVVLFLVYIILTRYDYTDQYDVPKVELPTQETAKEEQPILESKVVEEPVKAPVKKPRKPRTKKVETVVVEKKVKATRTRKKKSTQG